MRGGGGATSSVLITCLPVFLALTSSCCFQDLQLDLHCIKSLLLVLLPNKRPTPSPPAPNPHTCSLLPRYS